MDNEENVITLLVGARTTKDPYGQPIDMVARLFKCSREEVEALVKDLEAAGKIKRKVQTFRVERAGETSEYIMYDWVRPEEDWEESQADVIARPVAP